MTLAKGILVQGCGIRPSFDKQGYLVLRVLSFVRLTSSLGFERAYTDVLCHHCLLSEPGFSKSTV